MAADRDLEIKPWTHSGSVEILTSTEENLSAPALGKGACGAEARFGASLHNVDGCAPLSLVLQCGEAQPL